jgi:hypothetical protein
MQQEPQGELGRGSGSVLKVSSHRAGPRDEV